MNKLLKLTAAGALLSTSALYGQIEINDNLSITGFIDMSATYTDTDGEGTSSTYDLDQMELDFIYSFDAVTGQVDLDYQRGDANEIDLEQAFITYDLGDGASITAGKFLSYHGWETAEPTGLYQYSYAYDLFGTIPGYHNGVTYDITGDWGSFGIALLDSVFDDDGSLGNSDDMYEYGVELKYVMTPADGWTVYFGYALDKADDDWPYPADRDLINFWASYEVGDSTYAIELNRYEEGDLEVDQWLLMWSMAVSDKGTLTLRASGEDGGMYGKSEKLTAAYLHTVTDNLALVFELSQTDIKDGPETLAAAVEALFTF